MTTLSYTKARAQFARTMQQVCSDHQPVIITRKNEPPVVMLSLEDYSAIEETLYLTSTPKNATRLKAALESPQSEDITFPNLSDLKDEIGL